MVKGLENILAGQVFTVCRVNTYYNENYFLLKSGLNQTQRKSNFKVILPLEKCLLCTWNRKF